MPSVMAMISSIPASSASRIESAANRGGTKIIAVFAPSAATASWKVLNTGTRSSTVWPPLPGVTPATTWVPYSRLRIEWKVPSRPVMPEVHRRVCSVTRIAISASRQLDDLRRGAVHRRLGMDVRQVGLGEHLAADVAVGAIEAHDERYGRLDLGECLDQPFGHLVAAGDPAEDVEQHGAHLVIGQDHLDGAGDRVRL